VTVNQNESVGATINVWPINHIIFLAQENRSFDHYFGELRQYWAQNGYPDQSFDGLPQFNPTSGQPPLQGPAPSNPGCNPNDPYQPPPAPFQDCVFDKQSPITSYHLITQCIENPSPFWNEAHVDWDYNDPTGVNPAILNGFVWTAAHDAREMGYYDGNPFNDTIGMRALGYYEGDDLNYYYFMASNFATSDRFFNPVMTRTNSNRQYLVAATSQGYVYPIGSNSHDKKLLTATTIFQELQSAGITWKIYVDPTNSTCTGPPFQASCLLGLSYIQSFVWGQTIPTQYPNNIGTIGIANSDFDNDLANGTLPQVAQIEPASDAGYDEHPSDYDSSPSNSQLGAKYVSGLMNQVMSSQYWSDSAFILTYDEFGGLYDHVSPQPAVNPDGIAPSDLESTDICYGTPNIGTCNFTYTGYRVPLIVVSPYTKKNYVSHTVADTTAILKMIETRFSVPSLTARDAAQPDMSEYFDFNNPPWLTPPTPPVQDTSGPCYLNALP
jgi:phospholipase C